MRRVAQGMVTAKGSLGLVILTIIHIFKSLKTFRVTTNCTREVWDIAPGTVDNLSFKNTECPNLTSFRLKSSKKNFNLVQQK